MVNEPTFAMQQKRILWIVIKFRGGGKAAAPKLFLGTLIIL